MKYQEQLIKKPYTTDESEPNSHSFHGASALRNFHHHFSLKLTMLQCNQHPAREVGNKLRIDLPV